MSRRIRPKPAFALQQRVEQMWNRFDYPDIDPGPVPFELSGGGGAPTVVVAASDASGLSKSKADYVCIGVNDSAVIQAALDSLDTGTGLGGRVLLTEGTFNCDYGVIRLSDVTAQSATHLQGLGWSTILSFTGGQFVGIEMNAENGIVSDLWIKGNFVNDRVGIDMDDGQSLVRNVRISEMGSGTGAAAITAGVQGDQTKIHNCHIEDCDGGGILITAGGSTDTIITDTYVSVDGAAIETHGPGLIIGNCILLGNIGVDVQGRDVQISNTSMYGGNGDGITGLAERVQISNCIIYDFSGWGINLSVVSNGNRVTISDTHIVGPGDGGIHVENVNLSGLQIHHCVVDTVATDGGGAGIEINNCPGAVIDAILFGSIGGLSVASGVKIIGSNDTILAHLSMGEDYSVITGHGVYIEDSSGVRISDSVMAFISEDAVNTYDFVHLAENVGTTDRCYISGLILHPEANTGQVRYGINNTGASTNNKAIGNDLGAISDYGSDGLNGSLITSLPADATYGDNFTI